MKRLLTIFLAASLLTFALPGIAAAVPGNTCVWIYENGGQGGDAWGKCAPNWNPPATNDLSLYNTNLVGGCDRTFPNSPGTTWNDCVSSVKVTGLAPGKRIRFYADRNYSFIIACKHADGTNTWTFAGIGINDAASSWRVESGDC